MKGAKHAPLSRRACAWRGAAVDTIEGAPALSVALLGGAQSGGSRMSGRALPNASLFSRARVEMMEVKTLSSAELRGGQDPGGCPLILWGEITDWGGKRTGPCLQGFDFCRTDNVSLPPSSTSHRTPLTRQVWWCKPSARGHRARTAVPLCHLRKGLWLPPSLTNGLRSVLPDVPAAEAANAP